MITAVSQKIIRNILDIFSNFFCTKSTFALHFWENLYIFHDNIVHKKTGIKMSNKETQNAECSPEARTEQEYFIFLYICIYKFFLFTVSIYPSFFYFFSLFRIIIITRPGSVRSAVIILFIVSLLTLYLQSSQKFDVNSFYRL